MDLSALKQEIQDDAGLLSNWRKAFPGCRSVFRLVSQLSHGIFVDFSEIPKGDVGYPSRVNRGITVIYG